MDSRERNIYAGALDCSSINDLNDVIRVAEQVSDYILIPNVNSDVALGRYVAVAGQIQGDPRFPEAAWSYLDFAKIGAEYYAEHGGAYTHAGYVLRRQDAEPIREKETQIQLDLSSSQAQASVCLPATKEELERVKRTLGVDCFAEAAITKVSFSVPYMDGHIPTTGVCVEDANELAWAIEGMKCEDGELMKYLSVLSVEQPETMQDALRYAMNLDDYERIPEDAYEYGRTVLRRIGADDELIDTIDGYMDFEKLGEDTMMEDGVRRTEFGLIRRCSSPFSEETQAMEMGGLS
ncbi:antirestriction protein ArdA [[Clostridium] scindens]